MGLFDIFKKKENGFDTSEPYRPGTIEKQPSFIMAVPYDDGILNDAEVLMTRLTQLPYIKLSSTKITDRGFEIVFEYDGEEYAFEAAVDTFELPELFRVSHDFAEREISAMESAKRGLISRMVFGKNNGKSYHLQIKLLLEICPEPAGIVDYSSEKMLSGRWARLAVKSSVPPSPDYLYTVQAVSGKENDVWLHTHGLNRCGGIDLEVLNSDKENYNAHYNVLNTLAQRIISDGEFIKEYDPMYVMRISDNDIIVATWISYDRALKHYPKNILGGEADRADSHNSDTGVVYLYITPQDSENKKLTHLSYYNRLLAENPMQMLTHEETVRMRNLAIERMSYLVEISKALGNYKNAGILVKVGLEVDEEFRDGDMKEHIWFDAKSFNEEEKTFVGELTQEPYYVAAMKPGDIRTCTFDEITDWVAFLDGDRITPDCVYKFEN